MINKKYVLLEKIGEGSFGEIYKGFNYRTKEEVAIKIEKKKKNDINILKNESTIYKYLLGTRGIPIIKWYGRYEENSYMVINLLGKSLQTTIREFKNFSLNTVLQIGIQLLILLKSIHAKGLIHRDIKPENFLFDKDYKNLFLIDFGMCKSYIKNGNHIEMKNTNGLIGSQTYASINTHKRLELSRRDDLESLGYMLIYFSLGNLPWRENVYEEAEIVELKENIIHNKNVPKILTEYLSYIRKIEFTEKPKYELFCKNFSSELQK
jgi:serine/threonine protein kinase